MKTGYPVPDGEADASLTIKNSRFIGHAGKTETTGDAKAYINRIKERYPGATHVVYAYCIGFGASLVHGMSDAGEPSGTAGRPVLEVLKGSAIGDITLAVVRFFGGTKLGTGGLVRAYTDTAKATLAALSVKTKHKLIGIELSSPYEYVDRLKTIMDYNHAIIKEKNFSERAVFRILIPEENRKGFLDDVLNASGARIAYRLL
ncbi:MAG: YigZ family protein [Spirochaetales bacterium]|nr:YigZ family protein [Spirochaetales bacterium]